MRWPWGLFYVMGFGLLLTLTAHVEWGQDPAPAMARASETVEFQKELGAGWDTHCRARQAVAHTPGLSTSGCINKCLNSWLNISQGKCDTASLAFRKFDLWSGSWKKICELAWESQLSVCQQRANFQCIKQEVIVLLMKIKRNILLKYGKMNSYLSVYLALS